MSSSGWGTVTYTSSRVLPARPPPPRLELNDRPDLLKIQLSRQLLSKDQKRKQIFIQEQPWSSFAKVQWYNVNLLVNTCIIKHFSPLVSILPDYNELRNRGIYTIWQIMRYNVKQQREKSFTWINPLNHLSNQLIAQLWYWPSEFLGWRDAPSSFSSSSSW